MSTYQFVRNLGFGNVQDWVNDKNGKVNYDKYNKLKNFMLENGWEEIKDLKEIEENINKGDYIKYLTNSNPKNGGEKTIHNFKTDEIFSISYPKFNNKFRSGGFFLGIFESEEDNEKYLLYKPHRNTSPPISCQIKNIEELLFISRKRMKLNKPMKKSKYKIPQISTQISTDLPVKLIDDDGIEQIVYYAKNLYFYNRFINSKKFQNAKNFGWEWDFE